MRYLDVCAGISASSVAWKPLGWEAAAYSEIEPAPRAILEHRQGALPVGWDHRHAAGSNTTPLFGDFTQIEAHHVGPIDLLVGGTPCQDFSVAGLRAGLDGDRGNLSLEFLRLADRTRPRWLVWENVPGVLSINGGRAFGAILGGMGELGYGFAYRVLDAQHFGVPQRRRRVFVVGYLGDHRRAGAVLFERYSLSGHPAPRREAREGASGSARPGFAFDGQNIGVGGLDEPAGTLDTGSSHTNRGLHIAHALRGEGFDASEDGTGRGTPLVPVAFAQNSRDEIRLFGGDGGSVGALGAEPGMKQQCYLAFTSKDHGQDAGGLSPTLRSMSGKHANAGGQVAIAIPIDMRQASRGATMTNNRAEGSSGGAPGTGIGEAGDPAPTVSTSHVSAVTTASAVRRLTPRECERLQGFPDDYTLVPNRGKPMADGPRYKALGNSMAVPVMRWIGERIAAVDAMPLEQRDAA